MQPKKSLLPTILVSFGLLFSSATIALASTTSFDVDVEVTCSALSTAAIAPAIDYASSNNVNQEMAEGVPTGLIQINLDASVLDSATLWIDLNSEAEIDCDGSTTYYDIDIGYTGTLAGEEFIDDDCNGLCSTATADDINDYFEVYFYPDYIDAGSYTGTITVTLTDTPSGP